jgi:glycosyltransferase involved in cell wall biosynthesis
MSANIRLLQIIPNMDIGGAETGCLHVADYISKQGGFSAILTSGGKLLDLIDSNKIKIFKWPVNKNIFFIFVNIFYIFFKIKIHKINIVHARSRAPAWSAYFASKLANVKFVTTFHGTYNFKSKLKKFYNSVMVNSDHVIAGSEFILNHIHSNYQVKAKSSVVKRGIDEKYFSKKNVTLEEIKKLKGLMKINEEKFVILLPGRLTYWKGQKLFIEALNILNKQNTLEKVYALIIGSDQGRVQYKEELTELIKKYNLQDKIRIAHGLKKMPVAYSISNLVLSSSIEPEAFGRVSVEGQSMEKPVLASDIGGSLETVINNKTGWLFKNNEPEDLAEKIKMIIATEQNVLNLIGRQGRKNVKENYTREFMVSRTLEIYKSLVY